MRWLTASVIFASSAMSAHADVYSVFVDARDSTVREDRLARIPLPLGAAELILSTSGSASHGQGSFGALLVEYKDGEVSVQRAIPMGRSASIPLTNSSGYPLQFYFVDSDPSDNSGLVTVSVSGSATGSTDVSPLSNCLSDVFAASISLPSGFYMVNASGAASWGGGAFATVTLMYSDGTGTWHFQGVTLGEPAVWMPESVELLACFLRILGASRITVEAHT